jgi:hypothetical protein
MATAFQFLSTTGTTSVATVDYHNGKQQKTAQGTISDDPILYNHPQFALSSDFSLPVINQAAASIYDRIIPAPGGDFDLINAVSKVRIPNLQFYHYLVRPYPS